MSKDRGYIKLYRSASSSDLWLSDPFSRGQAWVDLLMLANYADGFLRSRGQRIEVKRGQVGWSVVKLAERWSWSRGKAIRFLNELEREQQIEQQKSNVTSLITIVNYEYYQSSDTADDTASDTANVQQTVQQTGSKRYTKKKNNNNNNITNTIGGDLSKLSTGVIQCPEDFTPNSTTLGKCHRQGCKKYTPDDLAKFISYYRAKHDALFTIDGWQEKFIGWMINQKTFDSQAIASTASSGNRKTKKPDWAKVPSVDDDLWPWAEKYGYPGPGQMDYYQYRRMLWGKVKERQDKGDAANA